MMRQYLELMWNIVFQRGHLDSPDTKAQKLPLESHLYPTKPCRYRRRPHANESL